MIASPMVSVIVPNYNHDRYLEQRINTVLSQTYRNYEVIILDDCSTDNSRDIIERYRGHDKISGIYYNEVNSGSTFRQWVKGIDLCMGEYVWIAESDDWCENIFIEEIITGLTANDNCIIGYCQSYCVQDVNKIKWLSTFGYLSAIENGPNYIKKNLLFRNLIFNASMAIWRKDAFRLISKEFVNYRFCGDWLFWIELCRHGNVFISGKFLNYFRKHAGDVSSKLIKEGISTIEELKMFHLLYTRGWISYAEFVRSYKSAYGHHKTVEQQMSKEKRKEIESLFYAEKGLEATLRFFYIGYYTKHIIKKVINRLVR